MVVKGRLRCVVVKASQKQHQHFGGPRKKKHSILWHPDQRQTRLQLFLSLLQLSPGRQAAGAHT